MSLPNIIFIITDQQRYDTIAGLGASFMQTPHLDRLVSEGISFDQCHCTGAVCVPSRASLFSMEYPHTVRSYTNSSPWQQCWVEDFQKVGYHTINVGKMHTNPIDGAFGFDQRYIVENKDRALPYDNPHGGFLDEWDKFMLNCGVRKPSRETYRLEDPNWSTGLGAFEWPLEEKFHPDTFVGTMAQWAVETREADTPLFLQIGFPGPHPPYDSPRRFLDLYENTDIPVSLVTDEELYNLNADPSEIHNLWAQPEYDPTKTELLKILREWHLRQSAIYRG